MLFTPHPTSRAPPPPPKPASPTWLTPSTPTLRAALGRRSRVAVLWLPFVVFLVLAPNCCTVGGSDVAACSSDSSNFGECPSHPDPPPPPPQKQNKKTSNNNSINNHNNNNNNNNDNDNRIQRANSGVVSIPLFLDRRQGPKAKTPEKGSYEAMLAEYSYYARAQHLHISDYYGHARLGEAGEIFRVVFDTGSGNLIVPSSACESEACSRHRRYRGQGLQDDDLVTITFGTGEVTGSYQEDRVCLGIACSTLGFVAATNMSDDPFLDARFDGILGLSLPQLSQSGGFSILDELIKADQLQRPIFSVFLDVGDQEPIATTTTTTGSRPSILEEESQKRNPSNPTSEEEVAHDDEVAHAASVAHDEEVAHGEEDLDTNSVPRGEVLFGSTRPELFQAPLQWLAVSRLGYWQVELIDLKINGVRMNICAGGCQAAFDTGTSLLAGPARYMRQLSKALAVPSDCKNSTGLPTLSFLLAGLLPAKAAQLLDGDGDAGVGDRSDVHGDAADAKADIDADADDGILELPLGPEDYIDRTASSCALSLMPLDIPAPYGNIFILGEPFLRHYYTVYDRNRFLVGVAPARKVNLSSVLEGNG